MPRRGRPVKRALTERRSGAAAATPAVTRGAPAAATPAVTRGAPATATPAVTRGTPATSTRLPKARRRDQLLETAHRIAREEGTDALTLGRLAERAGVSKPVAYEHFETRSGLLIALYKQIDDRQVTALRQALERAPARLEDVARVASVAYMDCCMTVGPEWHAITAAMRGDEAMEKVQEELLAGYVSLYAEAFAPYCDLGRDELRLRCVAIIGAAEAVARDLVRGRMDEDRAVACLASLIVDWLSPRK